MTMDPRIEALRPALQERAQTLGLVLDDTATSRLLKHLDLLQRWNSVYNLTAVREPVAMLSQHLVDCLAVVPALRRQSVSRVAGGQPLSMLDVGSGGGLPGAVFAILHPALQVTCVDTVAKKAGFLRQVSAELGLANLHAVHARVESLRPPRPFELITARAFSSLPDLVACTQKLLAPQGVWMAMKGQVPDDEIAALPSHIDVFHVERLAVPGLDAQRCLVWMRTREVE